MINSNRTDMTSTCFELPSWSQMACTFTEWKPFLLIKSGSFCEGAFIRTWVPSMQPVALGKPPTRQRPCLISSRSFGVVVNVTKSFTFEARASVSRRTPRLTVDLSLDKNVSPMTSRKLPEARKRKVTNTCSVADNEWLLLVEGAISCDNNSRIKFMPSLPKRYRDLNSSSL